MVVGEHEARAASDGYARRSSPSKIGAHDLVDDTGFSASYPSKSSQPRFATQPDVRPGGPGTEVPRGYGGPCRCVREAAAPGADVAHRHARTREPTRRAGLRPSGDVHAVGCRGVPSGASAISELPIAKSRGPGAEITAARPTPSNCPGSTGIQRYPPRAAAGVVPGLSAGVRLAGGVRLAAVVGLAIGTRLADGGGGAPQAESAPDAASISMTSRVLRPPDPARPILPPSCRPIAAGAPS